jgi:hypothetical protein
MHVNCNGRNVMFSPSRIRKTVEVSEDFSVYRDAGTLSLSSKHLRTLELYIGAIRKVVRRPVKSRPFPEILNYLSTSRNYKENGDEGWFILSYLAM